MFYPSTKFAEAVYLLATGPGDVRSRLRFAYNEFHPVRYDLLPIELQEDYKWICHELTKREENYSGQGRLDATLSRMQNRTGSKIAKRIYKLHLDIESIISPY